MVATASILRARAVQPPQLLPRGATSSREPDPNTGYKYPVIVFRIPIPGRPRKGVSVKTADRNPVTFRLPHRPCLPEASCKVEKPCESGPRARQLDATQRERPRRDPFQFGARPDRRSDVEQIIRDDGLDRAVTTSQRLGARCQTPHLDFHRRGFRIALDENQVTTPETGRQGCIPILPFERCRQGQKHRTHRARQDAHNLRAGLSVTVRVLPRRVQLVLMMGVLDRADPQPGASEIAHKFDDEGRLARILSPHNMQSSHGFARQFTGPWDSRAATFFRTSTVRRSALSAAIAWVCRFVTGGGGLVAADSPQHACVWMRMACHKVSMEQSVSTDR